MKKKLTRVLFLFAFLLLISPVTSYAQKIVVIDPGHGGKFSGTCGYTGNRTGFCEKDANLLVALQLQDILKKTDIQVHLTRSTDKAFASYLADAGGDFEKRMAIANGFAKGNNDNSVFLSIHHNAHPTSTFVRGIEPITTMV
ncbi:N-acetylmuramoyl-L-alanine amidase [Anaerobacillus sp. CMMVII]|uniref:N-acetylmuramoyl-L-alanine amidase family protein n=1 Tax=Anaerobacillus sp. CMMVII TaxID=2755588 RepID=UPI0021B7DD24|nr:N-acetylmuramoyl-L-alanine amidase [Anaerobacillus sp. CMMVII]MCT8137655.1 N-acetylmuramoyl-L-alanine amidase [Anaerobacillus sp. CMMVII]